VITTQVRLGQTIAAAAVAAHARAVVAILDRNPDPPVAAARRPTVVQASVVLLGIGVVALFALRSQAVAAARDLDRTHCAATIVAQRIAVVARLALADDAVTTARAVERVPIQAPCERCREE
jgi:hypothetical protein